MAESEKNIKDNVNDEAKASDASDTPVEESADQESTTQTESTETETTDSSETEKVKDLEQQVSSLEDRYLRAEAEIKNIQSRNAKERASLLKYDGQQLAHDLLPVVDNIERALQTQIDDEQGLALKKGIELVLTHLNEALSKNGVTEIEAQGQPFDPQKHQAVQTVPATDDVPADHVAQVLQKGYMLKDRVLRPAMVAVTN